MIIQKDLEYLVKRINTVTNSPAESYTRKGNGDLSANIGNFHLDYAYGGVSLERMTKTTGSVNMISGIAHVPKRELYNWMQAYLAGIELRLNEEVKK